MNRSFKRFLSLLLTAVLLLSCMATTVFAEPAKKKVTVMLYLCGTDLESKNGQATRDLGKILNSKYNTDEITVIALAGGCASWRAGYSNRELTLLNVSGRRPQAIGTLPLASMGDAATLTSFINYCYENYPADTYVLDLWDHGGGPILGLMQDQLFENDLMSIHELVAALDNSACKKDPLDLLIMNACLMSSTEVGAKVAPYASYMVASEDSFFGFTYDWLTGMENDATILDTAKRLVDSSFQSNSQIITAQKATEKNSLAVIDLSKITAVEAAMDVYFPMVASQMNDDTFTRMSLQRYDSVSFGVTESGGFKGYDLVDLGDLVSKTQEVAPAEAEAVLTALDQAVVYCRSDNNNGCTGLTVYHPLNTKDLLESFVAIYNDLDFSEGYTNYMHRFVAHLTGTALAQWTNLHTGRVRADKAVRTLFTLELTDEQAAHYSDARFEALFRHEDGSYTLTFVNNDVALENNALTAEFSGHALYTVAADGSTLSPALDYSILDNGTYVIPAELTANGEEGQEGYTVQALVYCAAEDGKLIPGRVYIWDEAMKAYTGALQMSFADYDAIKLNIEHRQEKRNEEGTLLPFEQWDVVSTEAWESAIDESWSFALVDDTLDTANLCATFQIRDSQSNFYNSDLLTIKVSAAAAGATHVTYDDCDQIIIDECSIAVSGDQMMLNLSVKQIAEKETVYNIENMVINGAAVDAAASIYGSGENWGLLKDEMQYAIVPVSLANVNDAVLTSITFNLVCLDAATNEAIVTIPVEILLNYDLSSAN